MYSDNREHSKCEYYPKGVNIPSTSVLSDFFALNELLMSAFKTSRSGIVTGSALVRIYIFELVL